MKESSGGVDTETVTPVTERTPVGVEWGVEDMGYHKGCRSMTTPKGRMTVMGTSFTGVHL